MPTISISADSRAAVKARILELNRLAQEADAQMRSALTAHNPDAANQWRQRRDGYNLEVKKLTDWLNNPTSTPPNLGSGNTSAPVGLTAEEEKRLAKLPFDIKFAEQQLARGDTRYQAILQNLRAELAELQRKQAGSTGGSNNPVDPVVSMTPEDIKKRLTELPYKIQYAEKMLAEYRRFNNAQKITEWAQELQNLEMEQARLNRWVTSNTGSTSGAGSSSSAGNTGSNSSAGSSAGNIGNTGSSGSAGSTGGNTGNSVSSGDFVTTTANTFNTNGSQDFAHNAILTELLANQYSTANMRNDPNARAYDAVRQNSGQPLHWIRNQQQAETLFNSLPAAGNLERRRFPRLNLTGMRSGQNFFVRDFMQIYSKGDLSIANTVVIDDTVFSAFAQDFDKLVSRINEYQKQHGRTFRVFPFLQIAHRDAFQLIPEPMNGVDRFGGAQMRNVSISGNVVFSDGALQGIFATDGAFRNLHIRSNSLQIGGEHTISISGMLSGSIMGNSDINNNPLANNKIALYPLRLGGGANIYVLGFRNKPALNPADVSYYQYEDILGVPAARDFRRQITPETAARGGIFYSNVDMLELQSLLQRRKPQTTPQWREAMAELARAGFAQQVTS